MTRHSVEYLNARRDAKPASGGKRYDNKRNAVDDRAQWAGLDTLDRAHLQIEHVFADFRRWAEHSRPTLETLAPGESYDDLAF